MAARTGRGETRWRKLRMDDEQWAALTERAEADGISASEALRRLAARYAKGEIKAGPEVPATRRGFLADGPSAQRLKALGNAARGKGAGE